MSLTDYNILNFKVPVESEDYETCSNFVVTSIEAIIKNAIDIGDNKIILR